MRRTFGILPIFACAAALTLSPVSPGSTSDDKQEEIILRDAEKIQRSMVSLVSKLRQSTVAIVRYVEKEVNGQRVEVSGGLGSGVVVSRDGKIFTNVHVIEGASRIEVIFSDGAVVEADLYSKMPTYDFALLRVRKSGLKPADFARTSLVEPGEWTIAAGNPRGLAQDGEPVVTLGIVSGKHRVAGGRYKYNNAVQTDAEINPGNSGGPLFDLDGRVIGINGLISTLGGAKTSVGVGYSIPADQILSFLPNLMSGDTVEPGYSGMRVEARTHEDGGVAVKSVDRGSPADKVGIRGGDRITGLNGRTIDNYKDWSNQVAMLPNGKTITVRLVRNNRTYSKKLTLKAPNQKKKRP